MGYEAVKALRPTKIKIMIIREAKQADLEAINQIYNEIHTAEESGVMTIGWIRDVYPTRRTAEESILRGDMFVLEEEKILGAGIINQTQVDVYAGAPWKYTADPVCVLHTLVISPDAVGRGLGRAFVEYFERWAAEHG